MRSIAFCAKKSISLKYYVLFTHTHKVWETSIEGLRDTQTVFGSTNRDSQYAVGTKMMVYKGSIYGLQQNTPKRKTCGDVSFGGIFGVAFGVDVVVRVVGA